MAHTRPDWEQLLYQHGQNQRRTQDSPVLPNVWRAFSQHPDDPVKLLITPHRLTRPADLAAHIRTLFGKSGCDVAHNQSTVAVCATFEEMVTLLVPLSKWWQQKVPMRVDKIRQIASYKTSSKTRKALVNALEKPHVEYDDLSATTIWWLRLIGHIADGDQMENPDGAALLKRALALLNKAVKIHNSTKKAPRLFRISVNRDAQAACLESINTVKADAARRVFDTNTSNICWAVIDSGIDASHPVFQDDKGQSRVKESYDFTNIQAILSLASTPGTAAELELEKRFGISSSQGQKFRTALVNGGDVDWELLKPALRVLPKNKKYVPSLSQHGTHVAGIIGGARNNTDDGVFEGMCPDIKLIDIRVLKDNDMAGEFDILAALQFIRHLNSAAEDPVVHGVNMSLQLQHEPKDYACGRTPICEESNRLVASGVVVVVAAGNLGITGNAANAPTSEGDFRDMSIADPGNAEDVITVGSTHRKRPHAYGVSYFSSRGPTGDGRSKPDLLAPGEKILGPVPGNRYLRTEGTSMAAPHVSGAAALLMARHTELIGRPQRIKEILCQNATDLGRERAFQGAGLVDILRALQSL